MHLTAAINLSYQDISAFETVKYVNIRLPGIVELEVHLDVRPMEIDRFVPPPIVGLLKSVVTSHRTMGVPLQVDQIGCFI